MRQRPMKLRASGLAAAFTTMALLATACGTDAGVSSAADRDAIESLDPTTWGERVIAAWGNYDAARGETAANYIQGLVNGESEVALSVALFEGEAAALETLSGALPEAPTDPTLEDAYGPFLTAIEADQDVVNEGSSELLTDGVELQAEFDDLDGGPDNSSRYIEIRLTRNNSNDTLILACFDLQTAIAATGGGILDCAGSDTSDAGPDTADDADPTTSATGIARPARLQAGTYAFPVFDRSLSLTFDDPFDVATTSTAIEIGVGEDDILVAVVETLADPTALAPECCPNEIELPNELGPWIDQLPVTVVAEGSWTVSGIESTWADIQFDFESDYPGDPVVALFGYGDGWTFSILPELTVRLSRVDHPEGPILIAVTAFDLPMSELGAIAERILGAASFDR